MEKNTNMKKNTYKLFVNQLDFFGFIENSTCLGDFTGLKSLRSACGTKLRYNKRTNTWAGYDSHENKSYVALIL